MEDKEQGNPIVKRLRYLLSFVGINPPHKGTKLSLFFTILSSYFGVETSLSLVKNWSKINSRLLALEDIIIALIMVICCLEYAYAPKHLQSLLSILDEPYFEADIDFKSEKRTQIIQKAMNRERITAKTIESLSFLVTFNLTALPVLVLLKDIISGESLLDHVDDLPLPFEYSYIFVDCTFVSFLVVYSIEIFWFSMSAPGFSCCCYMVTVLAMRRVKTELDILVTSLTDLDKLSGYRTDLDDVQQQKIEQKLKIHLKSFVRHHYFIIQKVAELNHGLKLTPTITLQAFCSLICFCLWYIVRGAEIVLKIKYAAFLIPLLIYLFLYAAAGQDIINGQDQLATTLYECPWMDKPKWFKTSIATMMLFVNKPFYVKQFGIYELHMPYFSRILNAGYSYFSLLNTVQ